MLSLRTVVVSDIHLGYGPSDRVAFEEFIDSLLINKPDKLILLGDVFDFWRRSDVDLLLENKRIVEKLLRLPLVFVRGNHDYSMLKLSRRYPDQPAFGVQTSITLRNQNSRFVMLHGYELEVFVSMETVGLEAYEAFAESMCHAGETGGTIASILYSLYERLKGESGTTSSSLKEAASTPPEIRLKSEKVDDLARSVSRTIMFGLEPSDVLIFGHTHRGFIERGSHTVNTGSWVLETDKPDHNYVEITDQSYELKTWPVSDDVRRRRSTLGTTYTPKKLNTREALKAAKIAQQATYVKT